MQLKHGIILISVLMLSGCTLHKVTDKQQLCNQAKRQQIFNTIGHDYTNANMNIQQKTNLATQAQKNCE